MTDEIKELKCLAEIEDKVIDITEAMLDVHEGLEKIYDHLLDINKNWDYSKYVDTQLKTLIDMPYKQDKTYISIMDEKLYACEHNVNDIKRAMQYMSRWLLEFKLAAITLGVVASSHYKKEIDSKA